VSTDARTARIRAALRGAPAGPDRVLAAREFDDMVRDYQKYKSIAAQYGVGDEDTQRIEVPR
jgi:hypothetical protein